MYIGTLEELDLLLWKIVKINSADDDDDDHGLLGRFA